MATDTRHPNRHPHSSEATAVQPVVSRNSSSDAPFPSAKVDCAKYTYKKRPWRTAITSFHTIIDHHYAGSGTQQDPYIVEWLEEDPECPKQYSETLRWSVTVLVAVMTLCIALASSAYSGTVEHLIEQFDCSEEVAILGLSLMVMGYAIGPLVWAPLSETIGRRYVFLWSYVAYTMWTCLCAASQNIETLIVFRVLAGIFGSSALCIPGGQIADMFTPERRGIGIGLFCTAPFLGPALVCVSFLVSYVT